MKPNAGGRGWPSLGEEGLQRLKGSLHNHTVSSDGVVTSPAQARRIYQDAGYRFVALTDHDRRQDELPWSDADYDVSEPGEFVLFRGYEASFPNDHVNCLGCRFGDVTRSPRDDGFVEEARRRCALLWLNHPAAYNDCPERVYDHPQYPLLHGLEVYSGARVAKSPGPLAETLWDACLRRGLRWFAFASADCHRYDPALPDGPFNGYVAVFADRIEPQAILDALRRGRFYASSGVDVERARYEGGELRIGAPNARRIRFIGAAGVLKEADGPEAAYRVAGDEGYVRVECEGEEPCFPSPGAPRKKAWLQPLWT